MKKKRMYARNTSIKWTPLNRHWLERHEFLNKATGKRRETGGVTLNALVNGALTEYFERRYSDQALLIFLETRKANLEAQVNVLRIELENVHQQQHEVHAAWVAKKHKQALDARTHARLGIPTQAQLTKARQDVAAPPATPASLPAFAAANSASSAGDAATELPLEAMGGGTAQAIEIGEWLASVRLATADKGSPTSPSPEEEERDRE